MEDEAHRQRRQPALELLVRGENCSTCLLTCPFYLSFSLSTYFAVRSTGSDLIEKQCNHTKGEMYTVVLFLEDAKNASA